MQCFKNILLHPFSGGEHSFLGPFFVGDPMFCQNYAYGDSGEPTLLCMFALPNALTIY